MKDSKQLFSQSFLQNPNQSLTKNQSGQAIVEYVLLLTAIAIGASLITKGILSVLDTGVVNLGGQLEADLKSGRAKTSVWRN